MKCIPPRGVSASVCGLSPIAGAWGSLGTAIGTLVGETRGRFYTEELTEGWEGLVRPPLARATRRPNHHDWQNAEP